MGKIILAREEDTGKKGQTASVLFVFSLITGFAGIPFGAVLSRVMQDTLQDSSIPVMYGFFLGPIFLGMLIGFICMKKHIGKDHTKCKMCGGKMLPMTEKDLLFKIPARGEQKYEDAFGYLAQNMSRVSRMGDMEKQQRGCYVCVYRCGQCAGRIVRIKDFLPSRCTCLEQGTYYFDYSKFTRKRGREDLTD